jgi:hypothetical protein
LKIAVSAVQYFGQFGKSEKKKFFSIGKRNITSHGGSTTATVDNVDPWNH